jgi:hypothetical protein
MERISRTYSLRRFQSSSEPDYAAALGIYVTNIAPDGRTNSNEISYWLDRSYKEFGDDFAACGFYVDKKPVGFTEIAYFKQQRIVVFDYLVLHKAYRSQGEYFQFVRMIQEWLDQEQLEFDFAVTEVSFESSGPLPSEQSILLVHLFEQLGFKAVECEYHQPPLGLDNPQSDMRAHLLLATREHLSCVKRETLLHIVRTMYFCHYERWYTPFISNSTQYKELLEKRFRDFEKRLGPPNDIALNGAKLLHPPVLPSRAPRVRKRFLLASPLIVILAYLLFFVAIFVMQSRLQLSWQTVALLFVGSMIVFAMSFSFFDKNAQGILTSFLDVLTKVFGKRK